MTNPRFVIGVITLAAIAAPHVVVAWRVEHLLSRRPTPVRFLAGIVVALGSLLLTSELLGAVGWFKPLPLLLGGVGVAAVVLAATRGRVASPSPGPPTSPEDESRPAGADLTGARRWAATFGVGAAVAAVSWRWLAYAGRAAEYGVTDVDSRTYHLPYAAEFVRTGSLARMRPMWPDAVHVFWPANSEVLQALAMITLGRDVLAPLANIAWFALLLYAGWCAGLRDRVAPLTLLAAAVVAGLPFMAYSNSGTSLSDVAMLACLMSALALWRTSDGDFGWLAVSALALGLALGAKLTVAPAAAALAIVLVVSAPAGRRRRALGVVAGALAVGCGFWFVRNLVHSGSPIPSLHIPLLPSVELSRVDKFGDTIAEHLFDRDAWRNAFWPGIRMFFGWAGPVAALGLAVAVPALFRTRDRALQAMTAAGAFGLLAYIVVPATAWGLNGEPDPVLFYANLRYAMAPLLMLAIAGALALRGASLRARVLFGAPLAAAAVYESVRSGFDVSRRSTVPALLAVVGVAVVLAVMRHGPVAFRRLVVVGLTAVSAFALLFAGPTMARRQLFNSYRAGDNGLSEVYAWAARAAPARIGYYLVFNAYPMYGPSLANDLVYLGVREPRSGFRAAMGCREFVDVLARTRADYIAIGPGHEYFEPLDLAWITAQSGTRTVLEAGDYSVFEVRPPFDPSRCPA